MISKILIPFDNSKYSKKALKQATEIAQKFDAVLYILSVVDEHQYSHGILLAELEADYNISDSFRKFIKKEVMNEKKNVIKLAHDCKKLGITVHHHAMKGDPTIAILDYAIANKINLIVMGSQGLHGIGKLKALGSVSRNVSEMAKCPVMIIR